MNNKAHNSKEEMETAMDSRTTGTHEEPIPQRPPASDGEGAAAEMNSEAARRGAHQVLAVKTELLRLLSSSSQDVASPSPPPCLPRCLDDELIYLYSLSRRHNAPEAARRLLKLIRCLATEGIIQNIDTTSGCCLDTDANTATDPTLPSAAAPLLHIMDSDIEAGLRQGIFFWPTSPFPGSAGYGRSKFTKNGLVKPIKFHLETFCDTMGHPVMYFFVKNINWKEEGLTIKQFKKTAIFAFLQLARTSEKAQTDGCILLILMDGCKMHQQFKREVSNFVVNALQEALPLKFKAIYCAHEPYFVSHILWPVLTSKTVSALKSKMLKERVWLGGKDFYRTLHPQFFNMGVCLPVCVGGKFEFDRDDYFEELQRIHKKE